MFPGGRESSVAIMFSFSTLVYLFVLPSVTGWFIRKYPGRKGIYYACAVLCLVAAVTTYTGYLSEKPESYYSLMETPVDSTQQQIKKAFRTISKKYHPDKLSSLSEEEKTARGQRYSLILEANDILSDAHARRVYDSFGLQGVEAIRSKGDKDYQTSAMIGIAMNAIVWGMLTFLLSLGEAGGTARTWSFAGLVGICIMEYQMRFSDLDFLAVALPYMPKFEKVRILWEIYPAFMRGSLMVAQSTFVDKEKLRDQQIAWIMSALQDIHGKVTALEKRGGVSTAKSKKARKLAEAADAVAEQAGDAQDAGSQNNVDPSKRAELKRRALANKMATGGGATASPSGQPPKETTSGLGIPRFVWGIAVYVFIQWVFSG